MEDFQKDHCTRLTLSKCNILARNLLIEVGSKKKYSTQDYSVVNNTIGIILLCFPQIYIYAALGLHYMHGLYKIAKRSLSNLSALLLGSAQTQLKLSTHSTLIQFPREISVLSQ